MEFVPCLHAVTLPDCSVPLFVGDRHVALSAFLPSLRSHNPWHLVHGPPGTAVRAVIRSTKLSGVTSSIIAKELNKKGVPSRKSGNWTQTTIRSMLTNEKYIGDCLFQKTYSDFRFKRHINHGEKDQFYLEDHHEPIISREDFATVGALLEQRAKEKSIRKRDSRYQSRYPFTSKLRCAECGSTYKRHINSTGRLKYPVWVCKKHLEDAKSCSQKYIREAELEVAFTTMMNKLIFAKEEVLDALLAGIQGETHKEHLHRIDEVDQKMDKNAEKRQTLTTLMTQGYIDPAVFTQESNDLAAEADALAAEKEQLVRDVTGSMHKTDALEDLIAFADHAEPSVDFDGALVERFLDHATLHSREEITFHLKCGQSLTERIGES